MTKHSPTPFLSRRTAPDRLSGAFIVGLMAAHAGCGAQPDGESSVTDFESEESGLGVALNAYGVGASVHTTGTIDHTNPFFQQLGSNPRTCATCHAPAEGWTTNSATNSLLLLFTQGQDPLFNLVDEGNRPDADVSTFAARVDTFKATLAERGLTRFTRTISPTAEFTLLAVDDPYGWSDTTRFSGFRRPTPTANESKTSSILWTGAPTTDVISQVRGILPGGAKLHEQRDPANPVTTEQAVAAGDFMFGVIFAQSRDFRAGRLDSDGAKGGPANLLAQEFYLGINDSAGADPMGRAFNPKVFDIYDGWARYAGRSDRSSTAGARGAIYRGQEIFNTVGKCGGCHDTPNVGGHSAPAFFNIGTAEPPKCSSALPLLTLQNKTTMETKLTCDPGRALSTGLWKDLGRFRAPPLRGLAARAPYFHDGQARGLGDVVNHYNERLSLGLNGDQKRDLEAFLGAL
jgi:cytochrome c peroxidase